MQKGMLWAGTDDGLVHLTTDDGAHWANVSPKDAGVEHGRSDRTLAARCRRPPMSRSTGTSSTTSSPTSIKTTDCGQNLDRRSRPACPTARSCTRCAKIRSAAACSTPARRLGVFVSFDDGAHWQPLQLNLPAAPMHDLVVKDDDLVVGDARPLVLGARRRDAAAPGRRADRAPNGHAVLYQPQTAMRLHYPDGGRQAPAGRRKPAGRRDHRLLLQEPRRRTK